MTDHPIIFSAPMILALLAGRKTQTRRLTSSPLAKVVRADRLWAREACFAFEDEHGLDHVGYLADDARVPIDNKPEAGEQWHELYRYGLKKSGGHPTGLVGKTSPSIHMPRWASRLTLIVTEVRFEKLQSIGVVDSIAEGIKLYELMGARGWTNYLDGPDTNMRRYYGDPRQSYESLWRSLHKKDGQRWEDNPDVLVLSFEVESINIDKRAA